MSDQSNIDPKPGQIVLVEFYPSRWRWKTQARIATYHGPDRWYIHGDFDGSDYYDDSRIAAWTQQANLLKEDS